MTPAAVLAHGVGRVYELPVPLYMYLAGAAATVLASFALATLLPHRRAAVPPPPDEGAGEPSAGTLVLRALGVVFVVLTVVTGVLDPDVGFTTPTLIFWVLLIVGMVVVNALLAGAWAATDPWALLAPSREDPSRRRAPWWLAPAGIYALFWFELISGYGFEGRGVVLALLVYSAYTLTIRATFADWEDADPLWLLFGFAGRTAPLEMTYTGIRTRSPVRGIDVDEPMAAGPFAAVFVLLASTTLDNVRETVGWSDMLGTLGLEPGKLVDSISLLLLTLVFFVPFALTIAVARRWLTGGFWMLARLFGWSLIPIGIAYVLAHNVSLLAIGVPELLNRLGGLFSGYIPSPSFVWFAEIALIVGGHVLGVLGAHRCAVRLAEDRAGAVRSQYALTVLMSVFTITTLWLLAQPLVEG